MVKKDSEWERAVTEETKEQGKKENPESPDNISVYDAFQTSRGTTQIHQLLSKASTD